MTFLFFYPKLRYDGGEQDVSKNVASGLFAVDSRTTHESSPDSLDRVSRIVEQPTAPSLKIPISGTVGFTT